MPRNAFFVLPFAALMAATSACNEAATDSSDTAAAPAGQPAAPAQLPAAPTSSMWQGGERVPLDLQIAHPNGSVLQLTSLQSRETETVVGLRIINGERNEISLNRFNSRDGYIVLPSGERLYLSPPAQNSQLVIQPGQTMEGELVFLGRLPPVQSAILVLNEHSSSDNRFTRTPGFRIDLPLAAAAPQGQPAGAPR